MTTDLHHRYETDEVFRAAVTIAGEWLLRGLSPHDLHLAASMASEEHGARRLSAGEALSPSHGDLPKGWTVAPTASSAEVAVITNGALQSSIDRLGVLITEHSSGLTGCIVVGTRAEVARWLLWAFDVAGPTGTWQPSAEAPWADHPAAMARAHALVPTVGAALHDQPLPDDMDGMLTLCREIAPGLEVGVAEYVNGCHAVVRSTADGFALWRTKEPPQWVGKRARGEPFRLSSRAELAGLIEEIGRPWMGPPRVSVRGEGLSGSMAATLAGPTAAQRVNEDGDSEG